MGDIHSEAIIEAKRLKELAFQNARDKLVESLEPKLRRLVDEQLMSEAEGEPVKPRDDDEDDVLLDLAGEPGGDDADATSLGLDEPAGISLPDEEGKVTLDLDDFVVADSEPAPTGDFGSKPDDSVGDEEMALSAESAQLLAALLGAKGRTGQSARELTESVDALEAKCSVMLQSESLDASTVARNLREVRDIYFRVREADAIGAKTKRALGDRLEALNSSLAEAEDRAMANTAARKLSEADIEVKLTGLPDDVDVSDVTASVEPDSGDDEEDVLGDLESPEGDDEMEDMTYEADDKMDELDEGELEITVSGLPDDVEADELSVDVAPADADDAGDDMGGDDVELSDDDVVEIPESMLRQEIARARRRAAARRLSEDGPGGAPGPKEFDDFGDASKEAELFVDYDDGDLNKNESRRPRRPSIREARLSRQVAQLKRALAEANLFNAKMVYANKLLNRPGMTDKQKVRVVESLDRARSINEVKALYRNIAESLSRGPSKKGLTESVARKRVPGSASRPVRSGAPSQKEQLNEGSGQVDRWGVLAGLGGKETV